MVDQDFVLANELVNEQTIIDGILARLGLVNGQVVTAVHSIDDTTVFPPGHVIQAKTYAALTGTFTTNSVADFPLKVNFTVTTATSKIIVLASGSAWRSGIFHDNAMNLSHTYMKWGVGAPNLVLPIYSTQGNDARSTAYLEQRNQELFSFSFANEIVHGRTAGTILKFCMSGGSSHTNFNTQYLSESTTLTLFEISR